MRQRSIGREEGFALNARVAVAPEPSIGGLRGLDREHLCGKGVDHELDAETLPFVRRSGVEGGDRRDRRIDLLDDRAPLSGGIRHQHHVIGARVAIGIRALDRLGEGFILHRTGPRDDLEARRTARGDRDFDLRDHLVPTHEVFDTAVVAHAFGCYLIFDLDGGGTRCLDGPDRPVDMHRIAETDAAIDDYGGVRPTRDVRGRVDEFGERQERFADGVCVAERTPLT